MSEVAMLLERFRRAPEVIAVMLTGVFGEENDFVPAPGKWSIRQITRHLADSETVAAYRFPSSSWTSSTGLSSATGVSSRANGPTLKRWSMSYQPLESA